ncbi:MAG: hypothetical protein AAGE52_17525 [Myxococcota bacterium]
MTRCFACLLLLSACDQTATVTFPIGAEVDFSADELGLPMDLRADDGTVRTLACGPMGMCPSTSEAPVTCEGSVCNPAPQMVSTQVGDVIDVDELASDVEALFGEIDSLEVLSVDYQVDRNTLTFPVEPIDIYWGPVSAVDIDEEMGVRLFGTVPALPAGTAGNGAVAIDAAGSAALTEFFETTSHQFRFFARTRVDLEPGEAWPEGTLSVAVRMSVRVSGSLL